MRVEMMDKSNFPPILLEPTPQKRERNGRPLDDDSCFTSVVMAETKNFKHYPPSHITIVAINYSKATKHTLQTTWGETKDL